MIFNEKNICQNLAVSLVNTLLGANNFTGGHFLPSNRPIVKKMFAALLDFVYHLRWLLFQ